MGEIQGEPGTYFCARKYLNDGDMSKDRGASLKGFLLAKLRIT